MKRHTAKIANTDQRCVVVLMQIPDREDHALICTVDNLPPRYEQAIMDLLESPEGQKEEAFYTILNRRLMPDTGKTVLQTLHDDNLLSAQPISNIMMMPRPNMPFPLVEVLRMMNRVVPNQPASQFETQKYNQYQANQTVGKVEQAAGVANNLLIQADMLEREARGKREEAYRMNPSLRPQVMPLAPSTQALAETMSDTIEIFEKLVPPLTAPKNEATS